MCAASCGVLLRAGRGGAGTGPCCPSASRASSGSAASSGVSKRPGAIVTTRMPRCARSRAAGSVMPDDAALRRRVGDLADLAVEGGDRRGVDADAALAVRRRARCASIAVGREPQDVERADQVDLDDRLERLAAGAGPCGRRPSAPSRCPRSRPRCAGRRRPRPPASTAASTWSPRARRTRRTARRARRRPPGRASALTSAIVTSAPAPASRRAVASPSPEAPPTTRAPLPSIRMAAILCGRHARARRPRGGGAISTGGRLHAAWCATAPGEKVRACLRTPSPPAQGAGAPATARPPSSDGWRSSIVARHDRLGGRPEQADRGRLRRRVRPRRQGAERRLPQGRRRVRPRAGPEGRRPSTTPRSARPSTTSSPPSPSRTHVRDVQSPYARSNADDQISKDGRSALVTFEVLGDDDAGRGAHRPGRRGRRPRRRPETRTSSSASSATPAPTRRSRQSFEDDFKKAETLSLPITLIILVLAFGALVAAGIPLLLGLSAVVGDARPRRAAQPDRPDGRHDQLDHPAGRPGRRRRLHALLPAPRARGARQGRLAPRGRRGRRRDLRPRRARLRLHRDGRDGRHVLRRRRGRSRRSASGRSWSSPSR